MAINTKRRRASVLGYTLIGLRAGLPPDGTIDAQDRAFIAGSYAGVTPTPPTDGGLNEWLRRRGRRPRLRHKFP